MTTTYIAIGVIATAIHLVRKVFANRGPLLEFFKQRSNVLYLIITPLTAALGLLLPDVGEAMGFAPNAWAAMVGWTGASVVGGVLDMSSGAAVRKAEKAGQ